MICGGITDEIRSGGPSSEPGPSPTGVRGALPAGSSSVTRGDSRIFTWAAASDAHSGVASYQYKIDDGSYSAGASGLSIDTTDLVGRDHTIYVRAVDNVGNIGSAGSHGFVVNDPPVASFTRSSSLIDRISVATLTSTSTDDDSIANYSWDLNNDGTYDYPRAPGSIQVTDNILQTSAYDGVNFDPSASYANFYNYYGISVFGNMAQGHEKQNVVKISNNILSNEIRDFVTPVSNLYNY